MSVKITLGNNFQKNQIAQEELNARLMELTENLSKANEEINSLNRINLEMQSSNLKLEQKILEISNENTTLKNNLELSHNKLIENNTNIKNLIDHNEALTQTNKLLKIEIEDLGSDLNIKNQKILHFTKEIEDVYKVKDKFEYKMIRLNEENEKLKENVKIYENVLKNKDKYIEILIRKNSDRGIIPNKDNKNNSEKSNHIIEKNNLKKNNDNNTKYNTSSNFSVTSVTNVIILQNKILELEEKLSTKDDMIKKIEKEKTNLLTRVRNLSIK